MPEEPGMNHPVASSEAESKYEDVKEFGRTDLTIGIAVSLAGNKKQKRSKRSKLKTAQGVGSSGELPSVLSSTSGSRVENKFSNVLDQEAPKKNPALIQGMDRDNSGEMVKKMEMEEVVTGVASLVESRGDMASYRFWSTQPVARFDEQEARRPDGPVREKNPEVVPPQGAELLAGFEWATLNLNDEKQLSEVYELLSFHYVEDNEEMFRFNYSASFLDWALKPPGWIPEWHIGVRVIKSHKLVAFISGVPVDLKVRTNTLRCAEINFLCIHKKLRSKRLAPVLIKEMTRRCNVEKVWNAIYTAGIVLPRPISTCRYYHRSLDWLKLYDVGFITLPQNSTKARQITKFHLPARTSVGGLREMEWKDVDSVHYMLSRYLERFDMAPKLGKEEVKHWLLNKESGIGERVIFTYVVENDGRITDFFSFYALESLVIGSKKHKLIRAAYLFYYASEVAYQESTDMKKELKIRLNELINDALILAKKFGFDVFNALTLLDNTLFLQEQRFAAGDGQLHYYLFNWRTAYIKGGIDKNNNSDEKAGNGIGIVML